LLVRNIDSNYSTRSFEEFEYQWSYDTYSWYDLWWTWQIEYSCAFDEKYPYEEQEQTFGPLKMYNYLDLRADLEKAALMKWIIGSEEVNHFHYY